MHALIIEDEFLVASVIEVALGELGYDSFDWAGDEAEAVARALRRPPALVTADVALRQGTGPAAIAEIRRHMAPPVIYVTANGGDLEGRGEIVVAKPFTQGQIRIAVASALDRHGAPRA
jgi:DNA-binding response OmpR family regulator